VFSGESFGGVFAEAKSASAPTVPELPPRDGHTVSLRGRAREQERATVPANF
jgi:hypothetical protein